jgi:CDP-diacylglycerol---glycerol-3-phosphate 3-phosphatidyltransferase
MVPSLPINPNMTLATWITFSRLLGIPFLLYFLHDPTPQHRWISLAIFLVVASTDWLDGYIARRFNQVTDLGKFLDPLVDKLLVLGTFLALIELHQVPAWGVFLILARELTIAGWRVSQTTISGANLWGKLKTVTQIAAIALLIAPLSAAWHLPSQIAFWLAVVLTIVSGVIYLVPRVSVDE